MRGGGHNIAGNAVCDGGLVIDLSPMKAVAVDAAARTARVEGGATLADFDRATQAHGLADAARHQLDHRRRRADAGRRLRLAQPQVRPDDRQPARGRGRHGRRRAGRGPAPTEHPDLFWAIRGGGGNFGVVTAFEFRLHPVGPEVLSRA